MFDSRLLLGRLLGRLGGLEGLFAVGPDHDDGEEGADDGGAEEDEDDGETDGPDAGGKEVLEWVVGVYEGLLGFWIISDGSGVRGFKRKRGEGGE